MPVFLHESFKLKAHIWRTRYYSKLDMFYAADEESASGKPIDNTMLLSYLTNSLKIKKYQLTITISRLGTR
jgi:hypothetical protein